MRLSDEYDVMSRVGLHCAPRAHRTLGTFPEGTVRFSMGPFTTDEDIDTAADAVAHIAFGK
jgi:selenocysteine lyase/cysteine desulfurase